jgi:hypothetical protein
MAYTTIFSVGKREDKYYVLADVYGDDGRVDHLIMPQSFDTLEEAMKEAKKSGEALERFDQGFVDA